MRKEKKILRKREKKHRLEDLPLSAEIDIDHLAKVLTRQIDKETFKKKYAPVREVLKLVGAGAFLAGSVVFPTLPQVLKPFLSNSTDENAWKRFNIRYLKRSLERLEKEKLVERVVEKQEQIVKITSAGRRRILRYALDELEIKKPKVWDGSWRLISYDLPQGSSTMRNIFRNYLKKWGFYPLHESVYLHAYPCGQEIDFLREYLGVGEYVRIFKVVKIENDKLYREFFGV